MEMARSSNGSVGLQDFSQQLLALPHRWREQEDERVLSIERLIQRKHRRDGALPCLSRAEEKLPRHRREESHAAKGQAPDQRQP